jgi:membrane protein
LFAVFVSHFPSYQLVYGAFAFFPLFIIWIYLSWVIVLMGAVMARALTVYRPESRGITPWHLAIFDVLHLFWVARQSGQAVTPHSVRQQLVHLSPEDWEDIRGRLLALDWIQRTIDEGYLFVGDFTQYSLADVLRQVGDIPDWHKMRYPWVAQVGQAGDNKEWQRSLMSAFSALGDGWLAVLHTSLQSLFEGVSTDQSRRGQAGDQAPGSLSYAAENGASACENGKESGSGKGA